MSDPNTRCIGGNLGFRRFAYLHKKDHSKFGLLEATDQGDARRYLGKQYHITVSWLTSDEAFDIGTNRARRWEIVSSIFLSPNSVKFVGKYKLSTTSQGVDSPEMINLRNRVAELETELAE